MLIDGKVVAWVELGDPRRALSAHPQEAFVAKQLHGVCVSIGSSELGVEASASGEDYHDVLRKIERLREIVLRGIEPDLADGAGI